MSPRRVATIPLLLAPPRALEREEIEALLSADVPARLATIDRHGFPHVTPLWFVWDEGAFHMTSFSDRSHLRRLRHNPRAGICIDLEHAQRDDGQRPNQQLRAIGDAELFADADGTWTRRVSAKYIAGPAADDRPTEFRTVIRLTPLKLVAVASV